MQRHRPCVGRNQRHFTLSQQRQQGFCVGSAPVQEQRHHPLLVNQVGGQCHGLFGVELVVNRHQLHLLPVDAAFGIHRVQIQAGAFGVFFHARRYCAGKA